jgi:cytochrome c556
MIKSLIRLAIIAVIGVLVYNYFLGDDQEKENARQIFQEVKEVGNSIFDFVKSEKEKFDAGKYDAALDKIGGLFDNMRSSADQLEGNYEDELTSLEQERTQLEDRLHEMEQAGADENSPEMEQLQDDLDAFLERTRQMIDLVQQTNQ